VRATRLGFFGILPVAVYGYAVDDPFTMIVACVAFLFLLVLWALERVVEDGEEE
jgi:hypothetical protein